MISPILACSGFLACTNSRSLVCFTFSLFSLAEIVFLPSLRLRNLIRLLCAILKPLTGVEDARMDSSLRWGRTDSTIHFPLFTFPVDEVELVHLLLWPVLDQISWMSSLFDLKWLTDFDCKYLQISVTLFQFGSAELAQLCAGSMRSIAELVSCDQRGVTRC